MGQGGGLDSPLYADDASVAPETSIAVDSLPT
jgi:hypothetical protein